MKILLYCIPFAALALALTLLGFQLDIAIDGAEDNPFTVYLPPLILLMLFCAGAFSFFYLLSRYQQNPKNKVLSIFNSLFVVVSFFTFVAGVVRLPDIKELSSKSREVDSAIPFEAQDDPGYLFLQGHIGIETFKALESQISKGVVYALELDSGGGNIESAVLISQILQSHGIKTVVVNECSSACVIIAVNGSELYASAASKFGFHRGSSISGSSSEFNRALSNDATETLVEALRKRKIPDNVIKQLKATPSDDMTYLSGEELYQLKVVNHLLK